LTPKQSPIEEGWKAGHKTAGAELQIKTSKAAQIEARQRIDRNPESRKSHWNDCFANPSIGAGISRDLEEGLPLKRAASTGLRCRALRMPRFPTPCLLNSPPRTGDAASGEASLGHMDDIRIAGAGGPCGDHRAGYETPQPRGPRREISESGYGNGYDRSSFGTRYYLVPNDPKLPQASG